MIGCLPTQALVFLTVFVYATQAIAFEWKPGLTYCCSKLINFSQKETIHEQAINKPSKPGANLSVYQCHENLTLAIRSAQAIGCNVVNIGPDDLYEGKEHIVLGLMWQVIRVSSYALRFTFLDCDCLHCLYSLHSMDSYISCRLTDVNVCY